MECTVQNESRVPNGILTYILRAYGCTGIVISALLYMDERVRSKRFDDSIRRSLRW